MVAEKIEKREWIWGILLVYEGLRVLVSFLSLKDYYKTEKIVKAFKIF